MSAPDTLQCHFRVYRSRNAARVAAHPEVVEPDAVPAYAIVLAGVHAQGARLGVARVPARCHRDRDVVIDTDDDHDHDHGMAQRRLTTMTLWYCHET